MSIKFLQAIRYNIYRQFQTSNLRLSSDIFHVQDDADFQKQVLDSKKPFLVDFQAKWYARIFVRHCQFG